MFAKLEKKLPHSALSVGRFGFPVGFFFLFLIAFCLPANAQTGQSGLLTDEEGKALASVKIEIGGQTYTTDGKGYFTLQGDSSAVSSVKINGKPAKFVRQSGDLLRIVAAADYNLLEGRVHDVRLRPITGVKVELYGAPGIFPVFTNTHGHFTMRLPPGTQVSDSSIFIVDGYQLGGGNMVLDRRGNFISLTRTSGQTPLIKDPPRRLAGPVRLKGVKVYAQGREFTLESPGAFSVQMGEDRAVLSERKQGSPAGNPYALLFLEGLDLKKFATASDSLPAAIETDTTSRKINDNISGLINDLKADTDRDRKLSREVDNVIKSLSSDELNEEERRELEKYMIELEEILQERAMAYKDARQQTDEMVAQFRRRLNTTDSLRQQDKEKLLFLEDERRELTRELYISVGIALIILLLAAAAIIMTRKFRRQRNEMAEQRNQLKTLNDELSRTGMQLMEKVDKIAIQNKEISKQSAKISDFNQKITDSLRYAETIQAAILPTAGEIRKRISDSFVLYRPKDIVSGDFYWSMQVPAKNDKPELFFIAAVDCTGHGVSGAFMSMIGNTMLNEIVAQNKTYFTEEILESLNSGIKTALRQEQSQNDDGMDVCLCRFHETGPDSMMLHFTGAKRPLYYLPKGSQEMQTVKGSPLSVGGGRRARKHQFERKEMEVYSGDLLYLTSDGFADQNAPDRRKYGTGRLLKTLTEMAEKPLENQAKHLENELNTHMKKDGVQRDDITVIGIKI